MNQTDINVLKSKFKRHKISHQIDRNKITIGVAKINYPTLIGFVIFPLLIFIACAYYVLIENSDIFSKMPIKIMLLILSSLGFSIFYAQRLLSNRKVNNSIKTFYNKSLKIEHKNFSGSFDKRNTKAIGYSTNYLEDDVYEGTLFLLDTQENIYPLLGFDDEHEKYVIGDLKWFAEFFSYYLELENIDLKEEQNTL